MGNVVQTYFRRTQIEDDTGRTQTVFLPEQSTSLHSGQCMGAQTMTQEALEAYTSGSGTSRETFGADATATADTRLMMGNTAQFIDKATLVGTESVSGRNAYHLRAKDIGQMQEADGLPIGARQQDV